MSDGWFISYSNADGKSLAHKLADDLLRIEPSVPVWLDSRELKPGFDWDEQIVEALRTCAGFLYVMTPDSVQAKSECKREWTRALRYKKPIIPLSFDTDAEMPYRLEPRQYIDFSGNYEAALAKLRSRIQWQASPEGLLQALKDRLADAERDLARSPDDAARIRVEKDIEQLTKEIEAQAEAIAQPETVKKRTSDRIESALERERQPTEPEKAKATTKFINPPPATAPTWFQNRFVETKLIADFIKNDGLRLMTVVGRGGVGKTAMVCRVLKALERGQLPDDLGALTVNGIVYLSPKGLRQVNLPHLYADLCKLLPAETAKVLESTYQNPQASARAKMQALLNAFSQGKVVVLLDNFETVTDAETGELEDAELAESLQALLELPNHAVKVIITTRVAPRSLQLAQPGYQTLLRLESGRASGRERVLGPG
ncbi:MAG: TIR domain-containing protein [Cyanobacteria bacterium J06598_3]